MLKNDDMCINCSVLFEFCNLVDDLMQDIIHLEAELVSTRYELSQFVPSPRNEYLRSDIFSSLSKSHQGNKAYDTYVELFCNNQDPMEEQSKVEQMWNLAKGKEKYNI